MVILLVIISAFLLIRSIAKNKFDNRDMSLPFTLKFNSINNLNYQLLQSEENFEISVSAYRLLGKPN